MESIRVNLGERSYTIRIGEDRYASIGAFAKPLSKGQQAFIISDGNVKAQAEKIQGSLEASGFKTRILVIAPGEHQKSSEGLNRLYDYLANEGADRQALVVAVGGGVVGDLAGFAAATYNRGLPLLMVPTTLLAMVDSSVGGKVAINHPLGKNLIGSFHQPAGVYIDTSAIESLPDREFRSGLAEVVKYGVILDPEFFSLLEECSGAILRREPDILRRIIARSCRLKADVVEKDEREETGLRAILNYGHTFGHAFETVGGYGSWLHGEAVSAGMACASRLAEKRFGTGPELTERQDKLLAAFGLPVAPLDWPIDSLLAAMARDKKASYGRLRFILPTRLGEVVMVDDIDAVVVRQILQELITRSS